MKRRRKTGGDPRDRDGLLEAAQRLALAAQASDSGLPQAALRWAAARAVASRVAKAIVAARGQTPSGGLFAAPPQDAPAELAAAAALVAATTPEVELPRANDLPATFAALGEAYPRLLAPAVRKRAGAWFTPAELAQPTAERAIAGLADRDGPLRIADPAAGAGAFLLAALRVRVAAGRDPAATAACELHGVDSDPTAAQLAALALHEACGARPPRLADIEANVRYGDGLLAFADGACDVVLGNPPWETLQKGQGSDAPDAPRPIAAGPRGKAYTYRLFLERALRLLRPGGRLGMILPASLYFDRDAAPLRRALLDDCAWEWLFGFQNRLRIFAIDGRYRFCAVVAQKGGRTQSLRAAFLRERVSEWAQPEPPTMKLRPDDLQSLSPGSGAFVEVRCARTLAVLRKMAAHGMPLLGEGGLCRWRQGDFNITSDRGRFVSRREAEKEGYRRADGDVWRRQGSEDLLPLYQGGMIGQLHPNRGAYHGGSGRGVRWRPPEDPSAIEPQHLVRAADCRLDQPWRIGLRALSNATNARSAIACLLDRVPCGNSLGVLWLQEPSAQPLRALAFAAGALGSLCYDWALRQRLAGTNLNGFLLADTRLPRTCEQEQAKIAALALRLCAALPRQAAMLNDAVAEGWLAPDDGAVRDEEQRATLHAELEARVARAFGLDAEDFAFMLRDCDLPTAQLRRPQVWTRLDPKGFWRVDKALEPEHRLCARALRAFGGRAP